MTDQAVHTDQPVIPARYYLRVAEVLLRAGVDVQAVFRACGLNPAELSDPDKLLRVSEIEAIVAAVQGITGRSDLPLDFGRHIQLGSHSVVGYALLSSPTVEYALRLAARFFRLMFPAFRMRYRRHRDHAAVEFQPVLAMSHDCLVFHIETIAVAAHFDIRELLEHELPAYEMRLSIARPLHHARYAELIGARCRFGALTQPGLSLTLPLTLVDEVPASADPALLGMAEQRCRGLLSTAVAERSLADWVRMMLRESADGFPSQEELAHALNISTRTLDRHLAREGERFRDMLNEERRRKACALLEQSGMTITRIAYELGYSDAANFTRAFRREQGCSPSAYREAAIH